MSVADLDIGTEYLYQAYWETNNTGGTITAIIEGDTLTGIANQADKVTNRIPEFSELTPDMQLEHEGHLWAAVAGLHVVGTSLIFNFCERVLP